RVPKFNCDGGLTAVLWPRNSVRSAFSARLILSSRSKLVDSLPFSILDIVDSATPTRSASSAKDRPAATRLWRTALPTLRRLLASAAFRPVFSRIVCLALVHGACHLRPGWNIAGPIDEQAYRNPFGLARGCRTRVG